MLVILKLVEETKKDISELQGKLYLRKYQVNKANGSRKRSVIESKKFNN